MPDKAIRSTSLPGIGDRHEFTTGGKECLGVVRHDSGERELVVFSRDDPDACRLALKLSGEEARRLAYLLGEDLVDEQS